VLSWGRRKEGLVQRKGSMGKGSMGKGSMGMQHFEALCVA